VLGSVCYFLGASLHLYPKDTLLLPHKFQDIVQLHKITTFSTVPSFLDILTEENIRGISKIISGGEYLSGKTLSRLSSECTIFNTYGPTETTVIATCCQYFPEKSSKRISSIGTPIGNTTIKIVDANYNRVPIGVLYKIGPMLIFRTSGNDSHRRQWRCSGLLHRRFFSFITK
jgi:non-ribosomal peptide synthetase component F